MDPVDCFTRSLDLMIVSLGTVALFAIPFQSQFVDRNSSARRKLRHVEIMSLVMIALSVFGLMR